MNTNKLIKNYQGATGLKTGSTSLALFNLSASVTRENLSLIAVVMRAPTTKERFSCARKLLDYGFSNYQYKKLAEKDCEVMKVPVMKGTEAEVAVKYSDSVGKVMKKKEDGNVEQEVIINGDIIAPIQKGDVLGNVFYRVNGEEVASVELVADSSVEKLSFFNMGKRVVKKWFYLFRN